MTVPLQLFGHTATPVEPSKGTQWNATLPREGGEIQVHAAKWDGGYEVNLMSEGLFLGGGVAPTIEGACERARERLAERLAVYVPSLAALTRRSEGGGA